MNEFVRYLAHATASGNWQRFFAFFPERRWGRGAIRLADGRPYSEV
jgi:hypothetical protein